MGGGAKGAAASLMLLLLLQQYFKPSEVRPTRIPPYDRHARYGMCTAVEEEVSSGISEEIDKIYEVEDR